MGQLTLLFVGPSNGGGGASAPGAILTESSDFLTTEAGAHLITDQNIP